MKKTIAVILVFALIGFVGWQVYLRLATPAKQQAMKRGRLAVAVEVAQAGRTTIRDVGLFTGTLYPNSQFVIAPKIAGRLEKLHVKIGDTVRRNQLIAELESDEYLQQVDQAKAELEVARANLAESRSSLEIAAKEFERVKTLRQKKIASESELDASEAQLTAQQAKYKVALAQVSQKEAALKAAQVRLSYTQIRASWEDGDSTRVVGERFVDEGAMLAANTSIVSILDTRTLTGVIHIIEKDYPKIRTGQKASLETDAYPGRIFTGHVVRIAPLVKEMTRSARVELEVPNPDGLLKPGMFIRANIEFSRLEEATVVPVEALVKRGGVQGIFLLEREEMKARFVPVRTGMTDKTFAQVLEPALSGEVVTLGHHLLEDGSSVILPAQEPGGKAGRIKTGQKSSSGRP
jgi:RND family efflux transporter MFP subunit